MSSMSVGGSRRPTIREARPAGAGRLTEIATAAKRHWDYPEEWLREWRDQLAISSDYIAGHVVLVTEVAREIAGFAALEDHDDHWELAHLWVDPAHMRQGLGGALVREAVRRAQEGRPDRLRIESDPNAVPFYLGLGAVEVGTVAASVAGHERYLPVLEIDLTP